MAEAAQVEEAHDHRRCAGAAHRGRRHSHVDDGWRG